LNTQKNKCLPIFSDADDDLRHVSWRFAKGGYARRTLNRKPLPPITELAHHVVCLRVFGKKPDWNIKEVCDHINRNPLDNRRENLRIVSVSQNNRNLAKPPKYAQRQGASWISRISLQGKTHYIGRFKTEEEAQAAAIHLIEEKCQERRHA
jgi:HNH endonuclease